MTEYCKCLEVRGRKDAINDIKGEVEELLDEVSDIMFGVGRLIGGLFGKVYVRMPYDGRHVRKINKRMAEQGCVRSANQIMQGNTCLPEYVCRLCGYEVVDNEGEVCEPCTDFPPRY